jgi:hypothetical protein
MTTLTPDQTYARVTAHAIFRQGELSRSEVGNAEGLLPSVEHHLRDFAAIDLFRLAIAYPERLMLLPNTRYTTRAWLIRKAADVICSLIAATAGSSPRFHPAPNLETWVYLGADFRDLEALPLPLWSHATGLHDADYVDLWGRRDRSAVEVIYADRPDDARPVMAARRFDVGTIAHVREAFRRLDVELARQTV